MTLEKGVIRLGRFVPATRRQAKFARISYPRKKPRLAWKPLLAATFPQLSRLSAGRRMGAWADRKQFWSRDHLTQDKNTEMYIELWFILRQQALFLAFKKTMK